MTPTEYQTLRATMARDLYCLYIAQAVDNASYKEAIQEADRFLSACGITLPQAEAAAPDKAGDCHNLPDPIDRARDNMHLAGLEVQVRDLTEEVGAHRHNIPILQSRLKEAETERDKWQRDCESANGNMRERGAAIRKALGLDSTANWTRVLDTALAQCAAKEEAVALERERITQLLHADFCVRPYDSAELRAWNDIEDIGGIRAAITPDGEKGEDTHA